MPVYAYMLGGEFGLDPERSAYGLQNAIRQLRDTTRIMGKHDPLIWPAIIHIGI